MWSIPPVPGLLPVIKIAFGFAVPTLLGIAGAMLCQKRPVFGLSLLFAALAIFIGIAAPLLFSEPLPASVPDMIMLTCNAGWFIAGVALVFLGLDHRVSKPIRTRPLR